MGIATFLGFTVLVAAIAYFSTRDTDESTADGFYLGGRSLTAYTIAGSLLLTNLSTEQIVGLNGQAFTEGVLVMAWETLAAIAMIVTAIYLLPTIPEFIEKRFDTATKSIVTVLFLSGYMIVLLPSILYSGSLAFSNIFDLPELLGVSLIGMIYAIFGGLKAVAVSDLVNAIGLLIGGILIPIFGLSLVGDGSIIEGVRTLWVEHPEKFNARGAADASIPFGTIFTGMMLVQMFYWGTNQAIVQRVFAAKNLKEGQKGLLIAAFIKFLGPLIVVLPGIIAFHLYGDQITTPDTAYPILVKSVLPIGLVGFFAAVLFGAVLSSFNSALNSSATLFGFDLYKEYFKKDATEKQAVRAGKVFGICLAIAGMSIAPFIANAPDGLFSWLQEANGCYSIPILSMIVIGYFTKRVPAFAAKIGLLSGVILYSISQFIIKPIMVAKALTQAEINGITDAGQLSLIEAGAYPHFLHVMAILFVLNVTIMLALGAWKPLKEEFKFPTIAEIDTTPWKYVYSVGIAICVIVVSTYFIFH